MTRTETEPEIRTVDVVVETNDGHIALIERDWDPFEGDWALPGGHRDEGETNREAAVRELFEETGVRVAPEDLKEIGEFGQPGRDPRGNYVTVAYVIQVPAGTVLTAGDDARAARWWPRNSLPPLAFDHADILAAAGSAS
ncbi:NUDIX domain-containing protein [Streptomyces sp. NPDC002476]|uniref:NUDIX domain-containing protein n=1 Tax=Streptomyces sp. NPDC002476 TaxID=3364648 RepID=UPI0036CC52F4